MRVCILGASRGLGLEFVKLLNNSDHQLFLSSRRASDIDLKFNCDVFIENYDFSVEDHQNKLLNQLERWQPEVILYCAAGGPYGPFHKKKWQDHVWALNVSLIFPTKILYWGLNQESIKTLAFIGSSVAENKADPLASSYSMAKHGIKGLLQSVVAEQPEKNIYLFSPTYMDTDMLPQNSKPRISGERILPPSRVAQRCLKLIYDNTRKWHHEINFIPDLKFKN